MRTEQRRVDRVVLIGVAAALLVLAACDGGGEAPAADEPPSPAADADAEEVASSFVEAYGAFDAEAAITYLAPDAAILDLIGSVGAHRGVEGTPEELPLLISLLRAEGYRQTLDSCEAQGDSASGTMVHCTFDFHLFGSDRLGLGPYSGSYFDLTIDDGEIVRASKYWEIAEFSPQMWDPFAEWVSTTYPADAAVMYEDETYTGVRLSEESIPLWERHVREYVREVKQGTA
ncbi:MAG TPA: hypothetical protein VFT80_14740 [Actinomycetota bacterium]|nr:hypothetical protein [Actinomycetota bacterium]